MTRQTLSAQKRTVTGRRVKRLRKEGLIPSNVFGRKITSFAIQIDAKAFRAVYKEAGETGLVDLSIEGKVHPVLISESQVHPVTGEVIHIDFHEVDLTEKVTASIPVEIIGESPAVKSGEGTLVQQIDEIEVEALPTDLPDRFEVDITALVEIDQAIHVSDIKFNSDKVTIKTDAELIIAKIEAPQEEVVEESAAEGEEAATETPTEATGDAETPAAE